MTFYIIKVKPYPESEARLVLRFIQCTSPLWMSPLIHIRTWTHITSVRNLDNYVLPAFLHCCLHFRLLILCQVLILVTFTGNNLQFVRGNFCSKLSKEFVSFILIFKAKLVHNSVVSQ